jgi:glucan phosphoethanolaminetransferase (alkaline phosphatase superfamily)
VLNAFSATETPKGRNDLASELLWALLITIRVIFLLFIALIILVLLFVNPKPILKTKTAVWKAILNHLIIIITPMLQNKKDNKGDFKKEKEVNMPCGQNGTSGIREVNCRG